MSATMDPTSFSSRRQATTSLPQFHLPAPGEIPSMPKPSSATLELPPSFPHPHLPSSILTPVIGVTSDGLSPLSSANTGSSQGSGAAGGLAGYYGNHAHGSWPTPGSGNSSYTFGSTNQQGQSLTQSAYGNRGVYGHSHYGPRHPQSPPNANDALPPPTYDQTHHQSYQSQLPSVSSAAGGSGLAAGGGLGISQGAGGSGHGSHGATPGTGPTGPPPSSLASSLPSQAPPPQSAILNSQSSASHQQPPSTSPTPADPYSRTSPNQNYYAPVSSSHAPSFHPSYAAPPQNPSNSHAPPASSSAPRPLTSMVTPTGMAPPQPYRGYSQYPHMPHHMGGPIMSNINNPGGQMSLVPGGVGVHQGYQMTHHRMYGQGNHQTHQERPFRCDQCTQSFNRNHDLKRHKRIHLAVKPFPCTSCDKSFSRKDALKVSKPLPLCFLLSSRKTQVHPQSQALMHYSSLTISFLSGI